MCASTQNAAETQTRRRRIRRSSVLSSRQSLLPLVGLLVILLQAPFPFISSLSPRKFVKRVANKATNFVSKAPSIKNLSVPLPNKRSIRIVSHADDGHVNGHGVNGAAATDTTISLLKTENVLLRDTVRQLEVENEILKQNSNKLVLETFEGEGRIRETTTAVTATVSPSFSNGTFDTVDGITISGAELEQDANMWCDELEEGYCPVEPTISFGEALRDRAIWLVGLLVMQSLSGFILAKNEALLENHPVIIFFLTMLVGAGGNAGNQASVRVIRGLALGTLNERTRGQFMSREFKMAMALSTILSVAGFCRAIFFKTPFPEALAVTSALAMIVFSSVCLGAILPLILEWLGVDPAHSSTTIQVIMDILGVIIAVTVSKTILDGPFGAFLIAKLGG